MKEAIDKKTIKSGLHAAGGSWLTKLGAVLACLGGIIALISIVIQGAVTIMTVIEGAALPILLAYFLYIYALERPKLAALPIAVLTAFDLFILIAAMSKAHSDISIIAYILPVLSGIFLVLALFRKEYFVMLAICLLGIQAVFICINLMQQFSQPVMLVVVCDISSYLLLTLAYLLIAVELRLIRKKQAFKNEKSGGNVRPNHMAVTYDSPMEALDHDDIDAAIDAMQRSFYQDKKARIHTDASNILFAIYRPYILKKDDIDAKSYEAMQVRKVGEKLNELGGWVCMGKTMNAFRQVDPSHQLNLSDIWKGIGDWGV